MKTTASIQSKFCTAIQTAKYSSWVVQRRVSQSNMADSQHLEK